MTSAPVIGAAAKKGGEHRYDAIILDLYEGPYQADHLFGDRALALSRAALRPGGVFAVWSEDPDKAFEKRLQAARFAVHRQRPGGRGGRRHVVYIACKAAESQKTGPRKGGGTSVRKPGRKRA